MKLKYVILDEDEVIVVKHHYPNIEKHFEISAPLNMVSCFSIESREAKKLENINKLRRVKL